MYAIRLMDITQKELAIFTSLLIGPVAGDMIYTDKGGEIDGGAIIPLKCDDKRAIAIIQVLQMKLKQSHDVVRTYKQGPKGGWKTIKIPAFIA